MMTKLRQITRSGWILSALTALFLCLLLVLNAREAGKIVSAAPPEAREALEAREELEAREAWETSAAPEAGESPSKRREPVSGMAGGAQPALNADGADSGQADGNAGSVDGNAGGVDGNADSADGNADSADGNADSADGNRLDLNTAGPEELETLPGIGPVLAERIAAYRTEHGPFPTVEAVMEVSGIGEKKFSAMEPYIYVTP